LLDLFLGGKISLLERWNQQHSSGSDNSEGYFHHGANEQDGHIIERFLCKFSQKFYQNTFFGVVDD
jgi:hypothetical protein